MTSACSNIENWTARQIPVEQSLPNVFIADFCLLKKELAIYFQLFPT